MLRLGAWLRDNYYDPEFKKNKAAYLIQCALATLVIFFTLLALNLLPNAIVIASIGATSFIIFTMPKRQQSRPRYVLGGYVCSFTIGFSAYWLAVALGIPLDLGHFSVLDEFFAACAVGLSMFAMVVTNTEHPPAAAMALALLVNPWDQYTLMITVFALILLIACHHLLRHFLIDLL